MEDLNLENYSAKDLFRLFHLDISQPLNDHQMKIAKQMVLKSHPDKSNLPSKYFVFFSAAYQLLNSLYEITKKKKDTFTSYNYNCNYNDQLQLAPNNNPQLSPSLSKETFSQLFHSIFEKEYAPDEDESVGYADWLANTPISRSKCNRMKKEELEPYKKQLQEKQKNTMVDQRNVIQYSSACPLSSIAKKWDNNKEQMVSEFFSAELHASLNYTDLKQAYEESVIPVTNADFERVQQYSSVNDYISKRKSEETSFQLFSTVNTENIDGNNPAKLMKLLQEMEF